MTKVLTPKIEALTAYANGITGKNDTTLSDAVASLANGYGGENETDYDNVVLPSGYQRVEILTSKIEALITYANGITGKNDTTLSDAVASLANGYGSGGEPDYDDVVLPSEYQRVEYIESTGTQYIDTGVIGKNGIRILAKIGWTTLSGSLFGSRKDSGATRFFVTYYANRIDFGYGGDTVSDISPQAGQVYEIDFDVMGKTYNFGVDGTYKTGVATELDTECNMFIFGANRPYATTQLSKSIFKSMKITNANGETLRNFIPCYRKSDGVIGIYDVENDVFYTNAGTGDFVKGQDV